MSNRLRLVLAAVLVIAPACALGQTSSQAWPQRTVRFIVPLPPGSGMDLSARLVAERLSERWGQPVVVENRQGADGIPAVIGFLSARDNHTFLFSFAGIVTFNHLLHERLPYDPKDLLPVAPVIDNFLGVSATAVLKVDTLADLVAAAKARPGKLNWAATPGLPYYVLLALQKYAGIEMVQVAYRDFAPAYQDLNAGAASPGGHRQAHVRDQPPTLAAGARRPDRQRGRLSRPHVRWGLGHLRLARHAGGDQAARRRRHQRDHRRARVPRPRHERRDGAAHRHAGRIRRRNRGATRQGGGDPCRDGQAGAVTRQRGDLPSR
jgi:hypothetical protein